MSFIKMPGASVNPASRPIIAEDNRIGDPLQALYRGQYKLILDITSGEIQIYNLDNDPGEKTNLFGRKETYPPEIVDQIKGVAAKIQNLRAEQKPLPAQISPEIIEKLKALGYIK
jgi:arylsulfatase A-like enzyme